MNLLSLWSAGEHFEVISPWQEVSDIVVRALKYCSDFNHARKQLAYDSVLYGLGLQKKVWKKVVWRDYPGMTWEVPSKLEEVNRQRLRVQREYSQRENTQWCIWDLPSDKYLVMQDRAQNPNYQGPQIQDYVWLFYEQQELSPYYRGLGGDILYKLVYIKNKILDYWARLSEKHSQPIITFLINKAKAAFDASLGEGFTSRVARVENLLDQYEKMAQGSALVMDKDAEDIRFHEHGGSGSRIIQEFIDYIDGQIMYVLLGSTLTTSTGGGKGSYAMANVHRWDRDWET